MKVATSATVFQDSVGMRLSVTYSVVDDETGKFVEDNKRANRVIVETEPKAIANQLMAYAQSYVETLE